MNGIETVEIPCPYCGEIISVVVDTSAGNQKYIEDCEVCCRPITLNITIQNGEQPVVRPQRQDDL